MNIPRNEYPRPQFVRDRWLCLNGQWQFEIDAGDSGLERGLLERELTGTITVPFCPECKLSGVEHTDFMLAVWYRRQVAVPADWSGQRILLHFQAVDYDATVWIDGQQVGRHRGGFSPFACDITAQANPGQTMTLTIRARDNWRGPQPRGKQSQRYANFACLYTRTTGIWQSVWMEPVPPVSLQRTRITPDLGNGAFHLTQPLTQGRSSAAQLRKGLKIRATLSDDHGQVCGHEVEARNMSPRLILPIPEDRQRLWSTADPFLYDLNIELLDGDGTIIDRFKSYAGLRSIAIDGRRVLINGESVFQRLVLDQGYYPDGLMTAPSDEALVEDIQLAMRAGFNGARLHQKVFEERFLYHADRLGYLVWGEFGDWGCGGHGWGGVATQQPTASYITQWIEVLERDYAHPSIVGWCPLNETFERMDDQFHVLDDVTRGMFMATKAADATRPVIDASGYSHRVWETDIYDVHDYEQDPGKFAAHYANLAQGEHFRNDDPPTLVWSVDWRGQPFFVSEFGGIWWNSESRPESESWGYGQRPVSLHEFYERFEGLCAVLLDHPEMFGYCYTQLTDVFQEENGIYTFDRKPKFDMARMAAVQQRPAAIERAQSRSDHAPNPEPAPI